MGGGGSDDEGGSDGEPLFEGDSTEAIVNVWSMFCMTGEDDKALPDIRRIATRRVRGTNCDQVARLQGLDAAHPMADISFDDVRFNALAAWPSCCSLRSKTRSVGLGPRPPEPKALADS